MFFFEWIPKITTTTETSLEICFVVVGVEVIWFCCIRRDTFVVAFLTPLLSCSRGESRKDNTKKWSLNEFSFPFVFIQDCEQVSNVQ